MKQENLFSGKQMIRGYGLSMAKMALPTYIVGQDNT
jgi:hypothetical protein